jgi:hypothetical protein
MQNSSRPASPSSSVSDPDNDDPPPTEEEIKSLQDVASKREQQASYVQDGIQLNMNKLVQVNKVCLSQHMVFTPPL